MNLFIVAKLSNGKIYSKLKPYEINKRIKRIYLLRDQIYTSGKTQTILPKCNQRFLSILSKFLVGLKFIKTNRIDLILSFLLTPHGYIAYLLAFFTGKRWIHVVIAGHREFWIDGKLLKYINLYLMHKAFRIIVMGTKAREYLIKRGIDPCKIKVIPNVIDQELYFPKPKIVKKYDIVYAGRIDKNKNLSLLIHAIKKLKKDYPAVKAGIAGDGCEYSNVKQMIKDYHLEDNIDLMGYLEPEKICDFLNQGRIYVLCSKGEGFPLALLEAMCSGLACVSTNVGEIEDFIIRGENGFLLDNPDDVEGLYKILLELIVNHSLVNKIAKNALCMVDQFNMNRVCKLWDDVFSEVVNENKLIN